MVGLVLHLKQIKMQIWGKYNIIKIESKHKKRAGGRYRLLFSARGETDYETSNNSQKSKVNKKILLFYDIVKKMSIWLT